jgi:hypothetical protein
VTWRRKLGALCAACVLAVPSTASAVVYASGALGAGGTWASPGYFIQNVGASTMVSTNPSNHGVFPGFCQPGPGYDQCYGYGAIGSLTVQVPSSLAYARCENRWNKINAGYCARS